MDWADFWAIFVQATTEQKHWMWKELLRDGWMKNLSSHTQFEVMKYAPLEVLKVLKQFPEDFKYDTLVMLDKHVRSKNKRRIT